MTRRQHHKGRKRLKSWHRGQVEARNWRRITLPELGTGADPTSGTPSPLHRRRPRQTDPRRRHLMGAPHLSVTVEAMTQREDAA